MQLKPLKVCSCGIRYSAAQWSQLEAAGRMADGDGGWLELRHCSCGSTIAVELPRVDAASIIGTMLEAAALTIVVMLASQGCVHTPKPLLTHPAVRMLHDATLAQGCEYMGVAEGRSGLSGQYAGAGKERARKEAMERAKKAGGNAALVASEDVGFGKVTVQLDVYRCPDAPIAAAQPAR